MNAVGLLSRLPAALRPHGPFLAVVALAVAVYLVLAWPGAGERGAVAEEVQPHLARHPRVLDVASLPGATALTAWPPYEPGHPAPPRFVSTPQWPVMAYDGTTRQWPILIRGHQSALGTYVSLGLGACLGDGLVGWRRATVLLGLALLVVTLAWARRQAPAGLGLAAATLVLSWGFLSIVRTAYSFEVTSRLLLVAGLFVLSRADPLRRRAALAAGLLLGLGVFARFTVLSVLLPAGLVVLWSSPSGRERRVRAAVLALAVALPAAALAALHAGLGFATNTAPLSTLTLGDMPARLLDVPGQLVLHLAWLGDALHAIGGPLARAEHAQMRDFLLPACAAALPTLVALYRLVRHRAGLGERLYLAGLGGATLAGALVYRDANQFQLVLAVEPLLALALAEQGQALSRRSLRLGCLAAVVAVRLPGLWAGLGLAAAPHNPMLSHRVQAAALAYLERAGIGSDDLLTTTYNQAGVLEAWSQGRLRPRHVWPALRLAPGAAPDKLDRAWTTILCRMRFSHVLLNDGANLYESSDIDPPRIRARLLATANRLGVRLLPEAAWSTEGGSPGWSLWRVHPPPAGRCPRQSPPRVPRPDEFLPPRPSAVADGGAPAVPPPPRGPALWPFAAVLGLAVAGWLWPRRRHGPAARWAIGGAASATAVTLGALLAHVATLPHAPSPRPGQRAVAARPLLANADSLFVVADAEVARLSLPDGFIRARLPFGPDGPVEPTGLVVAGERMLVLWQRASGTRGFGVIARDRWLVWPREVRDAPHGLSAYLAGDGQNLVVAAQTTVGGSGPARFELRVVDERGRVSAPRTLLIAAATGPGTLCRVGGDLWLVGRAAGTPPCRVVDQPDGAAQCAVAAPPPGVALLCAGQWPPPGVANPVWRDPVSGAAAVLRAPAPPGGFVLPPASLRGFYWRSVDGRLEPVAAYADRFGGALQPLAGGFIVSRPVTSDEAAARGLTRQPAVTLLRLDAGGQARAAASLLRPASIGIQVPHRDEWLVFAADLSEVSRFEALTLDRRDAPGPCAALGAHLTLRGTAGPLFATAFATSLSLVPVVLLVAALGLRRRPVHARPIAGQRLLLGYLVLALPTLTLALQRLFAP